MIDYLNLFYMFIFKNSPIHCTTTVVLKFKCDRLSYIIIITIINNISSRKSKCVNKNGPY